MSELLQGVDEEREQPYDSHSPPQHTNDWCSGTMMVGGLGLNNEVKQRSQLHG